MPCCLWQTELNQRKKRCLHVFIWWLSSWKSKSIVRNVMLACAYCSEPPAEKINLISFKELCLDAHTAFTQQWVSCMLLAAAASQLLRGCCLSRRYVCLPYPEVSDWGKKCTWAAANCWQEARDRVSAHSISVLSVLPVWGEGYKSIDVLSAHNILHCRGSQLVWCQSLLHLFILLDAELSQPVVCEKALSSVSS